MKTALILLLAGALIAILGYGIYLALIFTFRP